jgi:hypothetical protein
MNFYQFAGQHPVLTFFLFAIVADVIRTFIKETLK